MTEEVLIVEARDGVRLALQESNGTYAELVLTCAEADYVALRLRELAELGRKNKGAK